MQDHVKDEEKEDKSRTLGKKRKKIRLFEWEPDFKTILRTIEWILYFDDVKFINADRQYRCKSFKKTWNFPNKIVCFKVKLSSWTGGLFFDFSP